MKLLDILRKLGLIRENGIFYIGGSDVLPPPLKGPEELLTLQALEQGDEDARQRLVEHNLRLVVYIARRFENTGVNLEDLISIGTIGLIKAISTYRLDKKIKLATYASRCIENEILMYIRKTANQKTEVSLDEPINMDCDGNELLLSDILGTDEDMIMRPLEDDVDICVLRQALRDLPDLPLVLYLTGESACLNGQRCVGMVGTRRPSAYGRQAAFDLSLAMAQAGAVIVSGLADGLDSEAHRAALQADRPTIAFLGTAIDKTYPAANAKLRTAIEKGGGAVCSEYPPGYTGRTTGTFLARNRLIAAQSEALCVAEARTRSGTLNTVHHAERLGRPVLAVPGSIYSALSEGTNELLRTHRAEPLCKAADALEILGIGVQTAAPEQQRFDPAAVSPVLNTLGGGGNRGNQLVQFGGSLNSLAATIVPVLVGYLMGNAAQATISNAAPALFIAMGIFALAFVVMLVQIFIMETTKRH